MNRLTLPRASKLIAAFVSLVLLAVLCASLFYWFVALRSLNRPVPEVVLPAPVAVSVDDATHLFGGPPDTRTADIHLLGVLDLDHRVAAILSVGGDTPHVVGINQQVGTDGTLAEVRTRSIVIDQHGLRSEIFIPAAGPDTSIYMR